MSYQGDKHRHVFKTILYVEKVNDTEWSPLIVYKECECGCINRSVVRHTHEDGVVVRLNDYQEPNDYVMH